MIQWLDEICREWQNDRDVREEIKANIIIHLSHNPYKCADIYCFNYGPDTNGIYERATYTVDTGVELPEEIREQYVECIIENVLEKRRTIAKAKQKSIDAIEKYNMYPVMKKEEKPAMPITRNPTPKAWMVPTLNGGIDIQDIQVYNNKVVKVIFSDGSFTKAVCGENDNFDLDVGITICVIKRMVGPGKVGHVWYNNLIRKAHQVMNDRAEEKKMFARIDAERKARNKKEQEKRKAGREKVKQEQIDIHSEAFLKALKEWKAAGGTCDLAN